MIPMQTLSQVVIQHIINKLFGKPCSMIRTTFKGSEIEVRTTLSGDDLKVVIKKIRGQVSGQKPTKKIWTPGSGEEGLVKPKKIISAATQR